MEGNRERGRKGVKGKREEGSEGAMKISSLDTLSRIKCDNGYY